MDQKFDYHAIIPPLTAQLRIALSNLHLAASRLVTEEARERDAVVDQNAAIMDQAYYRILRIAVLLSDSGYLTGEKKFRIRNADLAGLIQEVCAETAAVAEEQAVRLTFTLPAERYVCQIDTYAVRTLLSHLLSNAIKNTPPGGSIEVRMNVTHKSIQIAVLDTGRGMTEKELSRAFTPGLHGNKNDSTTGVGLGLALCRAIAQGHEGTLTAESHPGEGSRFLFTFPNRKTKVLTLEDSAQDLVEGFNQTLLALADALPASAFVVRAED